MTAPFVTPPQNIQAVIEMLMVWSYSREYLLSIGYERDLAEDEMVFDISVALELLGARLPCKADFKNIN